MNLRSAFIYCFIMSVFGVAPALAQTGGTVTGRVVDTSGAPVTDATVQLIESRVSLQVDAGGNFTFTDAPAGHLHLLVESRRLGSTVAELELLEGASASIEIELDPAIHRETIVVSASPDARGESEVYQPVNVLGSEELQNRREATLGETLNKEVGVSSTYFGPGSSRPVIRGFGGDRIRILEGGMGTGDASNVSPDHAVSTEASTAEQIEIVRGPATLLYGSNALGGVVNVIDNRVPSRLPPAAVTGTLDLSAGTVADERLGAIDLGGAASDRIAWHLDLFDRQTGDYEIPGPAESEAAHDEEEIEEEESGFLENSSLESRGGSIGASWIEGRGFVGLAFTGLESEYGVPGHAHHEEHEEEPGHEEEEAEEHVRIDLQQSRVDLKAGYEPEGGFFRALNLRVARTDYEHVELEGEEVGTRFTNDGWEGRLEAGHRPLGSLNGTLGLQLTSTDFVATGEEAFIPPTVSTSQAFFIFEEINRGSFDFQFGARWEHLAHEVEADDLPDRTFDGVSTSVGAIWHMSDAWALASSLARAVRLPTAGELYSDGPHAATRSYEVGDPALEEETSLGLDLSLRGQGEGWRAEITVFNNRFDGFIFESPTGEEVEEMPVFAYQQGDATFRGVEVEFHSDLLHREPWHLEVDLGGDLVRAELASGDDLPRIPPMRLFAGLTLRGERARAGLEVRRIFDQERTAALESATDGYTMVNAHVAYRFFRAATGHELLLRATNLTDELARSHVSPLKDLAPLPGRNVSLSYRLLF